MAANGIRFTRAAAAGQSLPVGFRFRPTEEELINYYLQGKRQGMDSTVSDVIPEINICDYEPRNLPAVSLIRSDDDEWYFFSIYKKNGRNQTKRATIEGFWKITGGEKTVKARDNKTMIGKKRILTFYRGHVRNSQRTNWGMHEYYIPQTNPNATQRDFVLCCVKKKSGENVDAANCDEGEPSTCNNASDFEYQRQLAHDMDIEEEHTQLQQSPDYFESLMFSGAHGNNDYHGLQSAFGDNELDENFSEFLDSVIVDWDQDSSGEITHDNIFNDSTPPQPIRRVYFEDSALSSDTDTEVLLAQDMSLQMLSEPPVDSSHHRRENSVMLRNQISRQAASSVNVVTDEHSDTHPLQLVTDEHSGTHQRTSRPEHDSRRINALNLKNASSVDVDAESFRINCIQLAPDEYYNDERTRRRTYPTSALAALGKLKELKQQQTKAKEAPERRASVDLPVKETSITKSNKEADEAQGNNAEKGMKLTQNATTAGNWKGCSFISWETSPPLTSPSLVYLFNTVLGAIMFYIFAREAVLYGQWC